MYVILYFSCYIKYLMLIHSTVCDLFSKNEILATCLLEMTYLDVCYIIYISYTQVASNIYNLLPIFCFAPDLCT